MAVLLQSLSEDVEDVRLAAGADVRMPVRLDTHPAIGVMLALGAAAERGPDRDRVRPRCVFDGARAS